MKLLSGYIKRNLIWLCLIFLITMLHLGYMLLINVKSADIGYSIILDLMITAVVFIIGFVLYAKKVKKLGKILEHPVEEQKELPEPADDIELAYSDIIENHDIARSEAVNHMQKQQSTTKDYYARWVHQIKTPISAARLLLQAQREILDEMSDENDCGCETNSIETNSIETKSIENNSGSDENYLRLSDNISELEDELFKIEEYVNVVLQYQRINMSGSDYVIESASLDTIIRTVIRKYAKTMIRKHIQIQYDGTDLNVYTDIKWTEFVLEQILSNAIKYTNKGTIHIQIVNEPNWCFIKVIDSGIGIKAEDLPRIFENGYTGYNGRSQKKATGIGLYLCKQILDKLGHSIRIESEIGKGTTVWIGYGTKAVDVRD